MSNSLLPPWTEVQQASCHSLSSGVCSNSCPLSRWCHPTILSSAAPFSSCPQSFPASGSFPMRWLFKSGGQSIGALASASVLPLNIQGWFPLGLTGLISLQSKIFSRVFSITTVTTAFFKELKHEKMWSKHVLTPSWQRQDPHLPVTKLCWHGFCYFLFLGKFSQVSLSSCILTLRTYSIQGYF